MFVKPSALLLASLLCFGFSGPDTPKQAKPRGPADWKPVNIDPSTLADKAERSFKSFNKVAGGITLDYKVRFPSVAAGFGTGYLLMNEYFWTPTHFRIQYMDSGLVPSSEYLIYGPTGKKVRLGGTVGITRTNFSPNQGLFNVASDAKLVEAWPVKFGKFLFSPFVGGNATLSRYVKALKRGVGGYKVVTETRTLIDRGVSYPQYRIRATRPAKSGQPKSNVEMIFSATAPYLPLTINATYGPYYDLRWKAQWYNKVEKLPKDLFRIDQ